VCEALAPLVVQLRNLDEAIARLDRIIAKLAQKDETARRLMSIPGFGPITASAMAATIQDTSSFAGPREFAAFLGLTPKQNSSGGKAKLGRISKMGNRNLRKLLVVGAHAVLFHRMTTVQQVEAIVDLSRRFGRGVATAEEARWSPRP
jgi:transposase